MIVHACSRIDLRDQYSLVNMLASTPLKPQVFQKIIDVDNKYDIQTKCLEYLQSIQFIWYHSSYRDRSKLFFVHCQASSKPSTLISH